jgi:hypothetical protein
VVAAPLRPLEVGIDNGTQVDPGCAGSLFAFQGELDRVIFMLKD